MAYISAVVPVYKGESCFEELLRRLVSEMEIISKDYEIVFVEDCGGDGSWKLICDAAKKNPRIKGIQLSRNSGEHHALSAGLDLCDGEWVVLLACDLQDPPEVIGDLYRKAKEGFDIVVASRMNRKDSFGKILFSMIYNRLISWLADGKFDTKVANFRIVSRKVVLSFRKYRESIRSIPGIMNVMGFRATVLPIEHAERFAGKSSYNFYRSLRLALHNIIAYSDKPLKLAVYLGFFIASSSFLYGAFLILRMFVVGGTLPGWTSLIVSVFFVGGVNLSMMGVLGVYLGKVFNQVKGRPNYLISEATFDAASAINDKRLHPNRS